MDCLFLNLHLVIPISQRLIKFYVSTKRTDLSEIIQINL